ncbi:winged helix-turn-helix domain-containing protein [Shewanella waksmanii]|uniref:winged helix-turn-helix domain-containing protein n=1 Tax=Shewanella waksmanii TaxID=213783 RepID=UPI0037366DB7
MLKDGSNDTRYQFANLTLNTQLGTLTNQQGQEIKLPKLSYRLLCVLLASAPAIVSQQVLLASVWPDAVVGDETLKQRIKLLRRALNDDANAPQFIEAIRGRGYRIIPQVTATPIIHSTTHTSLALVTDNPISAAKYPLYWKVTSLGLVTLLMLFVCIALLVSSQSAVQQTYRANANSVTYHSFDNQLYRKGLDYYHRYRAEDNRHAIDIFQSVISLSPNKAEAYAGLSDAYSQGVYQFNGPEQWQTFAIDNAYKAIALKPDSALGYKSLGLAYYNKGWFTKAINANLKALNKQQQFAEAMANVSYLYREVGQLNKALQWNEKALQIDKDHGVNLVHRGLIFMALQDYQQAKNLFDRALLLQPDSQLANLSIGKWYMNQEMFSQAIEHYQNLLAKAQYHNNEGIKQQLAQAFLYNRQYAQCQQLAKVLSNSRHHQHQLQGKWLMLFASMPSQPHWQDNPQLQGHWQTLVAHYLEQLAQGSDRASDSLALAMLYASINDDHQSQRYLIQAINQGDLNRSLIEAHPSFTAQKTQTQFTQLLKEIDRQITVQQQLIAVDS